MQRKRRLFVEMLERRIVLDGVGLHDSAASPEWESVIVAFNDQVANPAAAARGLVQTHGGQLGHVYEHAVKGFSAQLPKAAVQALEKSPQVKRVEPDLLMQAFGQVPTGADRIDADMNAIAGINGDGGVVDIDVAIIDSGIDADHPDLNVVNGQRFYTVTVGPPKSRGSFEDDKYDDDNGHGTHVAGTVGAYDDGQGVVGVAPGARLWAVKVLDSGGFGNLSDIIAGINWVTEHADQIEVANMSLGGQGVSTTYREAIQRSVDAGVVYVVAAGNEYRDILGGDLTFGTSDDTIPAAYPEVATISAMADTDGQPGGLGGATSYGGYADDTFADFSNFSNSDGADVSWYDTNNVVDSPGAGIDLMMPGVDIYSTYLNGTHAVGSGTSMAAPHAAGLAALYIAEHGRDVNQDGLVNQQDVYRIRQALIDAGKPWRSADGLGEITGPNSDSPDKREENLGWAGPTGPVDTAPVVTITEPVNGSTVAGMVAMLAAASDDDAVTQVTFTTGDSSMAGTNGTDGWSASWDSTMFADGFHTLTATASDTADQTASHSITVMVDNDDDLPSVVITNPADGDTVSGSVAVTADATDDRGVQHVEFFVGASSIAVDTDGSDGWSVSWSTTGVTDGSYTLTAAVTDSGSQTTVSDGVTVTVDNTAPAAMHVADLDGTSAAVNRKKWAATVAVTVQDASGSPVSNATVTGSWNNGVVSTAGTDAAGVAIVSSGNIDNTVASVTFAVDSVAHASLDYDPLANADPDGDSSGTAIVVFKDGTTAAPTGLLVGDESRSARLTGDPSRTGGASGNLSTANRNGQAAGDPAERLEQQGLTPIVGLTTNLPTSDSAASEARLLEEAADQALTIDDDLLDLLAGPALW